MYLCGKDSETIGMMIKEIFIKVSKASRQILKLPFIMLYYLIVIPISLTALLILLLKHFPWKHPTTAPRVYWTKYVQWMKSGKIIDTEEE